MGVCGSTESTDRSGFREIVPQWIYTVQVHPGMEQDKWAAFSDGMQLISGNVVNRHRSGQFDTDGARWSRGFTQGKHVFEVVFVEGHRGTSATIGVSLDGAALYAKGKVPLCGCDKNSWGIDLRTKRAYHRGQVVKKYPQTQVLLPDRFYMYLDADARAIQFGSDMDYYGTAFSNIPSEGKPLFPMVSSTMPGSAITMVYRGEGDINRPPNLNVPPPGPPINVVVISNGPPPGQPQYQQQGQYPQQQGHHPQQGQGHYPQQQQQQQHEKQYPDLQQEQGPGAPSKEVMYDGAKNAEET